MKFAAQRAPALITPAPAAAGFGAKPAGLTIVALPRFVAPAVLSSVVALTELVKFAAQRAPALITPAPAAAGFGAKPAGLTIVALPRFVAPAVLSSVAALTELRPVTSFGEATGFDWTVLTAAIGRGKNLKIET